MNERSTLDKTIANGDTTTDGYDTSATARQLRISGLSLDSTGSSRCFLASSVYKPTSAEIVSN
jgi:hypothetical protein